MILGKPVHAHISALPKGIVCLPWASNQNTSQKTVNYALALKNYSRNRKERSMKRFCEVEGYDYGKFLQYSRQGQKEYSVLKEADECQRESGGFIPLVVDGSSDRGLSMRQREGEIH